jgi:hypothetical protein
VSPLPDKPQPSEQQAVTDSTHHDLALRLAQLTAEHPDLQHLVTAWPDLPDAMKAGITAMVQATTR